LGALLVEKGLLTAEELEDALAAQQTSGKRLGQILIDRGHVSGPALTSALAEQYGIELKTEEGFGTGLRAEIERRHTTRRPAVAPEEAAVDVSPEAPEETETNGDGHGDVVLAELEPQLEEHWARLAEAEANLTARDERIAELEAELRALKGRLHESQPDGTLAAELAERECELDEREQVLEGRQRGILTAAADLEQRRRSLEERERFLARREAPAAEVDAPSAEVKELTQPVGDYRWNLDTLTRLVEESADDFPDRADEWRYTLFHLRNEADIDGSLPGRFDALVEECFGELLGPRNAAAALAR
jgi:hypothetical protein